MGQLRLALRLQRGAIIGWSIAFFLFAWVVSAFYRYIGPEYETIAQSMPEGLREAFGLDDFGSPEGFLRTELLTYLPLLLAIYAFTQGTKALAAEQEDRTLDLVLAGPAGRGGFMAVKALSLVIGIGILCMAAFIGLVTGAPVGQLDVPVYKLASVLVDMLPLGIFAGALGLCASAFADRRGRALTWTSAYVGGAFVVALLAPLARELRPLRWGSAFYYHQRSDGITLDFDPLYWLAIPASALVLYGLGVARFRAKDL